MNLNSIKLNPVNTGLNTVLLLFPCWLILFYFKDQIGSFIVHDIFSLSNGANLASALVFLIATLLKIFLLLGLMIFLISLLRTYIPVWKSRKWLMSMPALPANVSAGALGVITPFCSCSAVPLFISFLEAGIPLGITLSFLIASPLVNEVIIIMLAGLFGLKIAIYYLVTGLFIAIFSGFIIGKLKLEKYLPEWMQYNRQIKHPDLLKVSFETRLSEAVYKTKSVISNIWIYVVIGIAIGAVIHGYVPEAWLTRTLAEGHWYSLPLVVLAGIPLYGCSASIAPVAFALVDKGMPLGMALAFTMAVAGLSLPEFVILKKVINVRLLLVFAAIIFMGIIMVGYLFYWLL